LIVPTGWPVPSTVTSAPGYTTASQGTLTTNDRTISISGINLNSGQTLTIVYGSKASGGPGATAPSTAGAQSWATSQRSNYNGVLTALSAGSPSVTVNGADGSKSTLTPTSSSITANGSATQVLTVRAKDVNGNNINVGGATVTITKQSGGGSIGPVHDKG